MTASAQPEPAWDAFGRARRVAGDVQGWSVDDATRTVTYYVFAEQAVPPFPAVVGGYRVLLSPLPRAQAFRRHVRSEPAPEEPS